MLFLFLKAINIPYLTEEAWSDLHDQKPIVTAFKFLLLAQHIETCLFLPKKQ